MENYKLRIFYEKLPKSLDNKFISMKKINKNKGILFWVTGLPGSGKTLLANLIKKDIEKKFGKTLVVSGDDLRRIFSFYSFDNISRKKLSYKYIKFAKFITDKKINLIFATVCMFDHARKWNRLNIKNYCEIYIETTIKDIIKTKKKKLYQKENKNLIGIDIKPQLPKKPDIKIKNNLNVKPKVLKDKLLKKIFKNFNKK